MRGVLRSRFLVVVGKGGVGKTTTSAALALHLADEGLTTHLLSTDPAHSIGDVFEMQGKLDKPGASSCTPSLTLEELDATALAEGWIADVRDSVAELFDRGTYLDSEDIGAFLDHSLPGMDEVMAALRIADLAAGTAHDRIVIDTAPTGHTLRMLRSGQTLQGWVDALEAMAAKAAAVGEALTGRRIRLAGERVMDELADKVCRFERVMREDTDFVVVTRRGTVVAAETCRLIEELAGRRLHVRAVVAVGGGAEASPREGAPVFAVPLGAALDGCDGLRRWGTDPAPIELGGTTAAAGLPTRHGCDETLAALAGRELVFFAGKGGVGKSTCAGAFASTIARERDVLLLGLDPAGSLGDVLGHPVGPDGLRLGRLEVRQLDADRALRRFRDDYQERVRDTFQKLGLHASAALDRRVVGSLLDMAPPGLDEIFALDAILEGQAGPRLLVLDTAPTGHFLRLLAMPDTLLSWTRSVLRVLLRYRAALELDDFASDLLRLAKRLRALMERLADSERTGVVVVTLAERLPRLETDRLLAGLDRDGPSVAAVIENRWTADSGATDGALPPLLRAPLMAEPPVGRDRLEAFVGVWACA